MKYPAWTVAAAFVVVTGGFYAAFSRLDRQGEEAVAAVAAAAAQRPAAAAVMSQPVAQGDVQAFRRGPAVVAAERLQALAQCDEAQPQQCRLDDSDPRAAHFDLGQRVTKELAILAALARRNALGDVDGNGIARRSMQYEDGHVQEAALDLMSALPPNSANVDVILDTLQRGHDAQIYTQAMRELVRYPDQAARSRIESTLMETLQSGGHFAGQAVAQEIMPFLNSSNLPRFQELAQQLPPGSAKRRLLEGTLEEFKQQQSGG